MKATMHSVPRSAEKIKFPTTAAIFPMTARMLVLVALQRKIHFRRPKLYLSRAAARIPLFLALTHEDDKATNGELHPIKSRGTTSFLPSPRPSSSPPPHLLPFTHSRVCHAVAINLRGYARGCASERRRAERIRSRASKRRRLHYLNGTGITSTFTAVTILPAILVVTITAAASVSMYGGDCAQFIPKLLATDIRKAMTATMVLYPLIYGLFPCGSTRIIVRPVDNVQPLLRRIIGTKIYATINIGIREKRKIDFFFFFSLQRTRKI